jgi:hypothetical protein
MRKEISEFMRQEKSILLYAETCLVDNKGRLNSLKMNGEDFDNLDKMEREGLLHYGRLPFHEIERLSKYFNKLTLPTHWVSFSDEAWALAWAMRKERADKGKEELQKALEKFQ